MITRIRIRTAADALCPPIIPAIASVLLIFLSIATCAIADGGAPTDPEIAQAIARGVRFLRSSQSGNGSWNEPSQGNHRLGMTALAGLALMENGVAASDASIERAREVVVDLARNSNQTYDITLAILFLARQQKGHKGDSDALIRELAGRLSAGSHGGIWDYLVPLQGRENVSTGGRARAAPNDRRAAE